MSGPMSKTTSSYEQFDVAESTEVTVKRNRKKHCLALILVPLLIAMVAVAVIVPTVLLTRSKATATTAIYLSDASTLSSTIDHSSTITTTTATSTASITSTSATPTTDPLCVSSCNITQVCVNGVCVGNGNFAFSLTWSSPGDGDLVVMTPNNKSIYHGNRGPTIGTDYGTLDIDDKTGTGPENIFWNKNVTPPAGTYHACFQQYSLSASVSRPITATVEVRKPLVATQTYRKTFTTRSEPLANYCSPNLDTFVVSVNYP